MDLLDVPGTKQKRFAGVEQEYALTMVHLKSDSRRESVAESRSLLASVNSFSTIALLAGRLTTPS
ncbi:hypothetical protein [Methanoculleus chikugoensis]|uniref:hypothetical protein n=1 Tax=Methanoculleus chikugoensis TaxID=118126 RepID=UPI001C800884|nr:hypothetical protein [Methanoculleus chikugoensis]